MFKWIKMRVKGFSLQKMMLIVLIAGALSMVGLVTYINSSIQQSLQVSEKQLFKVKKGQSLGQVCADFNKQALQANCLALKIYTKLKPELANIKSGSYWLEPNMSLISAFMLFVEGKEAQFEFTIIEGHNAYQVLDAISVHPHIEFDLPELTNSSEDLARVAQFLDIKEPSIEGLLAPDTYYFVDGYNASQLLQRAIKSQRERLQYVWDSRVYTEHLKSPYELLILASIVEKESSLSEERATIASVFFNRFDKRMRLQTDPTVIYGVWHEYEGDIKRVHLKTKTPYNTYRINGLPPTPIANPSLASLEAVGNPESTDFLYFVASGTGGHTFSKTLTEHNRALKRYLSLLKEQKQNK